MKGREKPEKKQLTKKNLPVWKHNQPLPVCVEYASCKPKVEEINCIAFFVRNLQFSI